MNSSKELNELWFDVWSSSRDVFQSRKSYLSKWVYGKTRGIIAGLLFIFFRHDFLSISTIWYYYPEFSQIAQLVSLVYALYTIMHAEDRYWDEFIETCDRHMEELATEIMIDLTIDEPINKKLLDKHQKDFMVMYNSLFPVTRMICFRIELNHRVRSLGKKWVIVEGGLLLP